MMTIKDKMNELLDDWLVKDNFDDYENAEYLMSHLEYIGEFNRQYLRFNDGSKITITELQTIMGR